MLHGREQSSRSRLLEPATCSSQRSATSSERASQAATVATRLDSVRIAITLRSCRPADVDRGISATSCSRRRAQHGRCDARTGSRRSSRPRVATCGARQSRCRRSRSSGGSRRSSMQADELRAKRRAVARPARLPHRVDLPRHVRRPGRESDGLADCESLGELVDDSYGHRRQDRRRARYSTDVPCIRSRRRRRTAVRSADVDGDAITRRTSSRDRRRVMLGDDRHARSWRRRHGSRSRSDRRSPMRHRARRSCDSCCDRRRALSPLARTRALVRRADQRLARLGDSSDAARI